MDNSETPRSNAKFSVIVPKGWFGQPKFSTTLTNHTSYHSPLLYSLDKEGALKLSDE